MSMQIKAGPAKSDKESDKPMGHPEEQPSVAEDSPKFGVLLAVLVAAVALIGVITVATEAYYSK